MTRPAAASRNNSAVALAQRKVDLPRRVAYRVGDYFHVDHPHVLLR